MKSLTDKSKRLVRRYPYLKSILVDGYRFARGIPIVGRVTFNIRWRTELSLLGGSDPSESEHKSIIHFTLNRSASQFVKRVLSIAVKDTDMLHVDWSKMAGASDYPYLDHLDSEECQKYINFFKPKGYLYSHFGGFVKGINEIEKYKVVLIIRDPRDLLVSKYYSILNSHILPIGGKKRSQLKQKRREAENTDIDKWVKDNSDYYKEKYYEYRTSLLKKHSNVHVDKFENMIDRFSTFTSGILDYCKIDIGVKKKKYIEKLMQKNNPDEENVNYRNRSGTSGDYKSKLKRRTINYLNDRFKDELDYFGYEK